MDIGIRLSSSQGEGERLEQEIMEGKEKLL